MHKVVQWRTWGSNDLDGIFNDRFIINFLESVENF